jgi:tRNA pseudouridine38-40 synthase
MPRYFIEVSYKGTNYAGFQVQQNANTIQGEVEKALQIYFRTNFQLTGSSRTDAGVHAKQNFFHFDYVLLFSSEILNKAVYHLNAILPNDIVVKSVSQVADSTHCRFDAVSRTYQYTVFQNKDPFLQDRAYHYPYKLNIEKLQQAAETLISYTDFESFAKKNNQAFTNQCNIFHSQWSNPQDCLIYTVTANRFLRGMVRGLVGTMLKVGREITDIQDFKKIIENKDPSKADFSTPPQGLTLISVNFPKQNS